MTNEIKPLIHCDASPRVWIIDDEAIGSDLEISLAEVGTWYRIDLVQEMILAAVAKERERCAQLCEQWNAAHPERIAKLIRTGN